MPPKKQTARKPLWSGPYQDGITFSLLCKFIVCRERFRLKVVEGLREKKSFDHTLEYGSMWHAGEEALAGGGDWSKAIRAYCEPLLAEHPTQHSEILKWRDICLLVFPLYIKHWKQHPLHRSRCKILEEIPFRVPYQLPSGRTILLRGKYDAVFRIGTAIKTQENKTKGKIDEEGLQATVAENLQSMFYQVALRTSIADCLRTTNLPGIAYLDNTPELRKRSWGGPLDPRGIIRLPTPKKGQTYSCTGVLYNVVRRPLADRFAIKQRMGRGKSQEGRETDQQFYRRVASLIAQDPKYNFFQWDVQLSDGDVNRFRQRTFDPLMEQLCDWWDSIKANPFDPWITYAPVSGRYGAPNTTVRQTTNKLHWQAPWGVYNGMYDGFRGDYFEYLAKGRKSSVEQSEVLFPELA